MLNERVQIERIDPLDLDLDTAEELAAIDRAAIEAFRAEQLALADAASKRFAQAVGDAAEVLTPDQRQKAHELLQWRRGWHHWRRG